MQGISRHRFQLSEVKSVALPLGYIVAALLLPAVAIFGLWWIFLALIAALVFVPLGIALKKNHYGDFKEVVQMAIIWSTYLTARGIALFSRTIKESPR